MKTADAENTRGKIYYTFTHRKNALTSLLSVHTLTTIIDPERKAGPTEFSSLIVGVSSLGKILHTQLKGIKGLFFNPRQGHVVYVVGWGIERMHDGAGIWGGRFLYKV